MVKVRAHTCYLGKTGYSHHAREFFRELSKYVDLRIRNFTWDSNPDYINQTDLSIIDLITLSDEDGKSSDYPISHSFPGLNWEKDGLEFNPDVDIVLMDIDHHYFYDEYDSKIKIAYTVWESTELPDHFFKRLLKFDYLWVVTQWHKEVAVRQGYPRHRIFVVNEGVNSEFFTPGGSIPEEENDGRFKFMFFGRWDYRKAVPEIIDSFLKAFPNNEPVDLILSADNPYSVDGMNSTEERLSHYGFNDSRIKVKHFLSREDYVSYIKKGNILITCARSEGWNIPLIEAMASGTPVIYSDWGAQLEFAGGKGNPVKIKEERPASIGADLGFAGNTPGLYAEPDYSHLTEVLKSCYSEYDNKKILAEEESKEIRSKYSWESIGKQGYGSILKVCDLNIEKWNKKESVVILSHADTEEKIEILKRSLLSLKREGYFVIISSHILIPEEILQVCDYFICETDNPIVTHEEYGDLSNTVPIHYINYPDFELSYSFDFNHGYAALRLIVNGSNVSKFLGFRKTHFINYDYIIEDEETLRYHSQLLEENSVVSYKWNPENSINSAFFSAINEDILKSLGEINSKRDYFKYDGVVILEDFIYRAFKESGLKIWEGRIKDISQKNIINSIIIPTYPQIKTKNGNNSYVYLGYENSEKKNYICLLGNEEPLEGIINFENEEFYFSVGGYPMEFYPLDEIDLERGFSIEIPKYNKKFNYDSRTKKASLSIRNKELVKKLKREKKKPMINVNFIDGPFVEIKGEEGKKFELEFIDSSTGKIHYSTEISNNMWSKCSIEYYVDWLIRIKEKGTKVQYEYRIDLEGKNVIISLESSSLGDTIAWFPYVEEFRKKHKCNVFISTFKNELFESNYPHLNFIKPGTVVNNIYASYRIGWFYDGNSINGNKNPRDFKSIPMQSTASDILGIDPISLRPNIVRKESSSPVEGKYVCIGIHSTAQAKYWNNPEGWKELVKWLSQKGYKVVALSSEGNGYMGNYYPEGVIETEGEKTLDLAMRYLDHCKMFIGIGSGLSWLSWAMEKPTVIISGFSNPTTEPLDETIIRVFNSSGCNSCFNRHRLDPSDWNWCPDQKGTPRQFECTKAITSSQVIERIEEYLEKGHSEKTTEEIIQESYNLGMVQNHKEILGASEFFKFLEVENFMEIGTDQGGTFAIWSKLSRSKKGKRISVDLPHGEFGRDSYDVNKRDRYLKSLGENVTMFHGSSHDESMKSLVENELNGILVDFLFIDGDHTYEGVKQDFEMYKEFVKPGGWIGFHDIKDTEFHRNANCRVDILWNELEGEKIEFVDNSSSYGGIGFIKV
jgi:autotransporter strand-loop-strand O-heptosyltransferase